MSENNNKFLIISDKLPTKYDVIMAVLDGRKQRRADVVSKRIGQLALAVEAMYKRLGFNFFDFFLCAH